MSGPQPAGEAVVHDADEGRSVTPSPPADSEPDEYPPGTDRRRSRRHRALSVIGVLLLVLVLVAVGFSWYITDRYAGNITRIPGVFSGLDESTRPPPATPSPGSSDVPLTFLLVGLDAEAEDPTTDAAAPGGDPTTDAVIERSEVVMLVQLAADRSSAVAVSIPEKALVPVPGQGVDNLSAAFADGGPTLLVQTVEALTNIRIDHYLSVDFAGFAEVTDALGGVDVRIAAATEARGVTFTQGVNHLNGEQALAYVRQWSSQPGSELGSVQRHQNYLRAVMAKVARDNLLTDPGRLDDFLLAVTDALSVDDELSNLDLVSLVLSLRNVDPADVTFVTVPMTGAERRGGSSVVFLDLPRTKLLWSYLREGSLTEHAAEFERLPEVPR